MDVCAFGPWTSAQEALCSFALSKGWTAADGGGKTYRVNLGGENVLQSVLSKTTFGGLRNWGWSGRCLFLLREMTESRQKRGGKMYRRRGSKNVFGEGFFAEFTVCFPPPWVFHPPWPLSEMGRSFFGPGHPPGYSPRRSWDIPPKKLLFGLDVLNRGSRLAAIRIATDSQRFHIARFQSQGQKPFESRLWGSTLFFAFTI